MSTVLPLKVFALALSLVLLLDATVELELSLGPVARDNLSFFNAWPSSALRSRSFRLLPLATLGVADVLGLVFTVPTTGTKLARLALLSLALFNGLSSSLSQSFGLFR